MAKQATIKEDRLQVRLDADAKRTLERAAVYRRKTVSQFVLGTALVEAKRVIRENEVSTGSRDRDWSASTMRSLTRRRRMRRCAGHSGDIVNAPDEAVGGPLADRAVRSRPSRQSGFLLRCAGTRSLYSRARDAGCAARRGARLCGAHAQAETVRGFYALSATSFAKTGLPASQAKRLPHYPVPAVLIARLAVDRDAQGRGLGEHLLMDALNRIVLAGQTIAMHAVWSDARDKRGGL